MKLPHLTLRDLFWLVLVVAIGCAWWLNRRQLLSLIEREAQRAADAELKHEEAEAVARAVEAQAMEHQNEYSKYVRSVESKVHK